MNAKARLDKLIGKSRTAMYKPVAVAEILFRNRTAGLPLDDLEQYRTTGLSAAWAKEVTFRLTGRHPPTSNGRYWDQLFSADVLPPASLEALATANRTGGGVAETYIYASLIERFRPVQSFRTELSEPPGRVDVDDLFRAVESVGMKSTAGELYEILVYALFDALTRELNATVTLKTDPAKRGVLKDFADFTDALMGIDDESPEYAEPARLYRNGLASAADGGLDMWANFGPAVQVKHVRIGKLEDGQKAAGVTDAARMVIVCRSADRGVIESLASQLGRDGRTVRFVTEERLADWYRLAFSEKYAATIGGTVLAAAASEVDVEFPMAGGERVSEFLAERGYDPDALPPNWKVTA